MSCIRRQTEGLDGIHMTKKDKDLFSEESEKMYVTPVLEPKERGHRVCMSLDNKKQLTSFLPHAGNAVLPADRELRS